MPTQMCARAPTHRRVRDRVNTLMERTIQLPTTKNSNGNVDDALAVPLFRISLASCSNGPTHSTRSLHGPQPHLPCANRAAQSVRAVHRRMACHARQWYHRQCALIQTSATSLFWSQLARESRSDNTLSKSSRTDWFVH